MSRASIPTIGVLVLTLITVVLAAAVGVTAIETKPPTAQTPTSVSATATSDGRITLVLTAGPALDVDNLAFRITIDGVPLEHQPPIPFFAAQGFQAGPTGPFNSAAVQSWTLGEPASFQLAGTNSPSLYPGASVKIRIHRDNLTIAMIETTVDSATG